MNITSENKEKIKELYFKNTNIKNIAHITGIPETNIKRHLKTENLRKARQEYFRKVIETGLREKKLSEEVAAELNCDTYKLCKIAENLNIKIHFRQNRKDRREQAILEEFNKKPLNISRMSEKLGYSYDLVQVIYKKYELLKKTSYNYPYKKLNKNSYQKIVKELQEGVKTQTQIAKEYGVSKQWIFVIKQRLEKKEFKE